jgi:hypothetical protein
MRSDWKFVEDGKCTAYLARVVSVLWWAIDLLGSSFKNVPLYMLSLFELPKGPQKRFEISFKHIVLLGKPRGS